MPAATATGIVSLTDLGGTLVDGVLQALTGLELRLF